MALPLKSAGRRELAVIRRRAYRELSLERAHEAQIEEILDAIDKLDELLSKLDDREEG